MEGKKNRFFWLGDGSTYNEAKMTGGRESFFFLCFSSIAFIDCFERRMVSER